MDNHDWERSIQNTNGLVNTNLKINISQILWNEIEDFAFSFS